MDDENHVKEKTPDAQAETLDDKEHNKETVEKATSESMQIDEEEVMKTAMQLEDGNEDDKEMKIEEDENEDDEESEQGNEDSFHERDAKNDVHLSPKTEFKHEFGGAEGHLKRHNSNSSVSFANSDNESIGKLEKMEIKDIDGVKKTRRRGMKKKKKPDELLKCIICGRYGMTSEFCASGRFCSQRCVGAYASKCRADSLAAAAATGEVIEPRKRKRQKKEGKKVGWKKTGEKHGSFSPDFEDQVSPTLSPVSSSSEEVKSKKAKLSYSDDAYFFYNAVGKEKLFEWDLYLSIVGKKAAPEEVFKDENPEFDVIPKPASGFKAGMKLEAVDPKHPSCICAVSVVETQGARLRLHFDGWSESYDFWTNSDSHLLFPVGFCEKNGQKLHLPRGINEADFSWERYLDETKSEAAPEHLFKEVPETRHGFKTNMKLEAVDKKNPDLTCVASINNVIGDYLLVHFDEWDDSYDYWCRETCPYLHQIGWCIENGIRLTPPQDDQVDTFNWQEYLNQTNTIAVPPECLKKRPLTKFQVDQKLEVVDPRNPSLVRVGTIAFIEDFQLKIHFDGWDNMYDFWFDSESNDLHPVGWCQKTGHLLEPPPSFLDAQDTTLCPTPGCRGIGHVKGAKYTTHHSIFGCPYSPNNVTRGSPLVDRLANNSMGEESSIASRVYNCKITRNGEDASPDSTNKSELIKQQKLLKGIVGRPAKKCSDKPSPKTPKLFNKFGMKDKSKIIKRKYNSAHNPNGSVDQGMAMSTPGENGTKAQMRTRMPIIKVMSKSQNKLRFETSQIKSWSVRDVAEFIRSIGLVEHAMHFEEQQIDGQALLLLSQADMIHHLKIKLGPALKIANAITKAA